MAHAHAHTQGSGDHATTDHYYVPHQSYWPIIASIGLFTLMFGGATMLNGGGSTLLRCTGGSAS